MTKRIPVWRRNVSSQGATWRTLLSNLVKYKKFISVVSSLTVLGSFVVKEAWDSHLKEVIAAITTIETKRDAFHTKQWDDIDIQVVLQQLQIIKAKVISDKLLDRNVLDIQDEWNRDFDKASNTIKDLDYLKELAPLLSTGELYASFSEAMIATCNDYESEVINVPRTEDDKEREALKKVDEDYQHFFDDIHKECTAAFQEADAIRSRAENTSRLCARLSYVFFFGGWLVGLIAHVVDVPVPASE
jgi:hypothetical protein